MPRRLLALAALTVSLVLAHAPAMHADARTLTWARSGDALTLDPHAVNEGPTHTLNHHIYEPLVIRDAQGKTKPALAVSWRRMEDPLVWEFKLRPNVTFHDGSPFTSDDVLFSLDRARSATSDMRGLLGGIGNVQATGPLTVRVTTKARDPLLPIRLTDIMVLSRGWAAANALNQPRPDSDRAAGNSVRIANGTGPFKLVSREPGKRTELARNDRYWGSERDKPSIEKIVYLPIASDEKRIAALLDGSVDFVQDLPVGSLQKVTTTPGLRLNVGPENRVIFFGLNVGSAELASSDVRGRNPFADLRVRQAISIAIDRKAIQQGIMKGQSIPTGVIAPPGINGYPAALDKIPPYDVAKAKKLITDAGFGVGFTVTLNCPNDRYVNDDAICKAVAEQLVKVGIRANVIAQTKGEHFKVVRNRKSDFYLLGWGVPTFDSEYIFRELYETHSQNGGAWNGTGYSNPEVDKLITELETENDLDERRRKLAQIWERVTAAEIYIPLHIQTLAYAMKDWIDIPVDISNTPKLWHAKIKVEPAKAAPAAPAPKATDKPAPATSGATVAPTPASPPLDKGAQPDAAPAATPATPGANVPPAKP